MGSILEAAQFRIVSFTLKGADLWAADFVAFYGVILYCLAALIFPKARRKLLRRFDLLVLPLISGALLSCIHGFNAIATLGAAGHVGPHDPLENLTAAMAPFLFGLLGTLLASIACATTWRRSSVS